MTVSVIIPAYNRAESVAAAIESARAQTITDLDILVIDDGSSDSTGAIVRAIAEPRLRLLAHTTNRGAAAARNTGIAAAHGELIAFLDSDDLWAPHKLERQVAAMQAGHDLVTSGVRMRLLDHGYEKEVIPSPQADWLKALLADCNLSPGATLLARRSLFDRIGPLDESLLRFEDWDWLVRYAASGGAPHIVPEVLAIVNNRRGRLGRDNERAARRFAAKHAAARAHYGAEFVAHTEATALLNVAGTFAYARQYGDAARLMAEAAWRSPRTTVARLAQRRR